MKIMCLEDPKLYLDESYVKEYNKGNCFWERLCNTLVRRAELKSEDIVADLGCGTGFATKEIIKAAVSQVYAIDPSKVMLAQAKENLNGAIIINGTIDDLITSELQKPTVIISSGAFVVMQNGYHTLKKIYDYLDNGSRYIFTIENWVNANVGGKPLNAFEEEVSEYESLLSLDEDNSEEELYLIGGQRYTPNEVKKLIIKSGGTILKSYSREMGFPAKKAFRYTSEINRLNDQIKEVQKQMEEGRIKLGTGKILQLIKQLDALSERKRTFEEFRDLYVGKRWTVGTQHVFHTVRS